MNPRIFFLLPLLSALSALSAFAAEPPGKAAADGPDAEIIAGKKPLPGLKLELLTPKKSYELGEPIEVTLRYTYTGDRKLAFEDPHYERFGRISQFGFTATDAKGKPVRDPLAGHVGGGGGPVDSGELGPNASHERTVFLNEWLCFDEPGRYAITAWSKIVHLGSVGTAKTRNGAEIPLASKPLSLDLTPPVEAHRLACLAGAKHGDRSVAIRSLSFLVDPRTIPALLDAYQIEGNGDAFSGLLRFRDMAPVRAEILRRVERTRLLTSEDIHRYSGFLAAEHLRARNLPESWIGPCFQAVRDRWSEVLGKRSLEQLVRLPGPVAAELALDALAQYPPTTLADWKTILARIPAMSKEPQQLTRRRIADCLWNGLIPALFRPAAYEGIDLNVLGLDEIKLPPLQAPEPKKAPGTGK